MSEKTPNIEKITARKASDPKAPEQKATGAKKKLDPKKKKWLIAGIALLLVAAVAVVSLAAPSTRYTVSSPSAHSALAKFFAKVAKLRLFLYT